VRGGVVKRGVGCLGQAGHTPGHREDKPQMVGLRAVMGLVVCGGCLAQQSLADR